MARGKVLDTIVQISGEISPTLGKTLDSVVSKLDGVNLKAVGIATSVAAVGGGVVVGMAKAGKALATLGDGFNSAVNDLSAQTGIVGAELDSMADSMQDIYAMNLGEDFNDIADSMAYASQNTGLVGEELESLTADALRLRDTFDYDVSESTRAADALMTNFGISGEEAMNLIASGAQNGLDYSGELIDTINEYSVQFAKVGLDAEAMFAIMQSGADGTAWNLDKVGDTIKEFSIRAVDGSDTTIAAFEAMGMDADAMMQTFAEGGEAANEAFYDVLDGLLAIEDPVARDAAGVNLLGTMWEDMGVDAIQALADTRDAAYDAEGAMQTIADVKYDNIADAFEGIKRSAEVTLLPMATMVSDSIMDLMPTIEGLFETLGPVIQDTLTACMPFVEDFLVGIGDTLTLVLPMVAELAAGLLPLLMQLVSSLLPPILSLIQALLPPIIQIVQAILPPIVQLLTAILPMITQIVGAILPVLVQLISNLLPIITPLLEVFLQIVNDAVMPLLAPLMQIVQSLLPPLLSILQGVISFLSPILGLLQPIASVLATIVGWISKVVSWVSSGLGWVVSLFTGDVVVGTAPDAYATGGFTDGLGIVGEDPRYPTEAVISFNPAYRQQNLGYWARAGRMLGATAEDAGYILSGGSSGGDTIIDMGGITFAPNITISGKADRDSVVKAIEAEYPEFLDMLEGWLYERGLTVYAQSNGI